MGGWEDGGDDGRGSEERKAQLCLVIKCEKYGKSSKQKSSQ
jgi:hypothetical protein